MVRPIDRKFSVWLSNYYDDFNSSTVIAEAGNNQMVHTSTHYGNPMNNEATLNPYYRWSWENREGEYSNAVTSGQRALHNAGIHEFLSVDVTKLGFDIK